MTTNTEVLKTSTALEAPVITFPEEGSSVRLDDFEWRGTAEPRNAVWVYVLPDQLNPIFGQAVRIDGGWHNSVKLAKGMHRVFARQSTPDSSETSPASPTRTFWVI